MLGILEKKGLPIATEYGDKQTKKKHVWGKEGSRGEKKTGRRLNVT